MNAKRLDFWSKYTDRQILDAMDQFLYSVYGFEKERVPQIRNEFLRRIYFATHVLEFLISKGWGVFEKSPWNIQEFYDSIGYFNGRFLDTTKERITYFDPEIDDEVRRFVVDTQALLEESISEAIRFHNNEFDDILNKLEPLIAENIERRDRIYLEKWKQE